MKRKLKSKLMLLALIGLCSSPAKADSSFGSPDIMRALTLELTINFAREICEFTTSAGRARVAFEFHASEVGADVREYQSYSEDQESDVWIAVTAMRAGRIKAFTDAITYMGKDNFCISALWMYGPNGVVYSGIFRQ